MLINKFIIDWKISEVYLKGLFLYHKLIGRTTKICRNIRSYKFLLGLVLPFMVLSKVNFPMSIENMVFI